ncbi:MAG: DNA polymerase I [Thermacetogeniaceae bacterium]|jgi:DNA polymerase-1|nr:DNA polymerase I [Syntrophomonadaceae bacterium]
MSKLVILDGNSLAYRAFYALPLLSTTTGHFTNAVYGFTTMLQKIIRQEEPDYLAVAFDAGRITFRNKDYSAYKANRKSTPDELRPQFPLIKKVLKAFNIPILELDGYEADDLIGVVVRAAEKRDLEVLIVSGDRDLLQLVSDKTKALITRKGISDLECFTPGIVKEKYGVLPSQIPDLKGLKGDQSDNIPGVPGIGTKTAVKLLNQFPTIEECYSNLDQLPAKVASRLKEYEEQALLSKKLATIALDAPVKVDFSELKVEEPDYEALIDLFQQLEFRSMLKSIQQDAPMQAISTPDACKNYGLVKSAAELKEITEQLTKEKGFAFYMQQEGVPPHDAPLSALGLAWGDSCATVVFPTDPEERDQMVEFLNSVMGNQKIEKWCHDAKAEMIICKRHNISLTGVTADTMLAAHLLNSSLSNPNLSEIALKHLNQVVTFAEDESGMAQRALVIKKLWPVLREALEKDDLYELFAELELPLSAVLTDMELQGIKVDTDLLKEMSEEVQKYLLDLTGEIYALAGEGFNINSSRQLGHILFEKLKLPVIKKTKTGYSTDAEVLEKLSVYHEIPRKVLEYRQLAKLKSTYIDGLINMVNKKTGRIHTTFNQTITATGRLSSTEPNLQNIPIRDELGRKIRKAFIPSQKGWLLMAADYSQIELRVMAHMSMDPHLIADFQQGEDIHTRTAAKIFGVAPEDVTPDLRRKAKGINFGIIYGITDYGLARDVGVSREEAALYIENYFQQYPGVKRFMEQTVIEAREKGYVQTILKRRRYLPDLLSSNRNVRAFGERTAFNTPIQGSAADIIKLAMINISRELKGMGLRAHLLLQVHDELVFELPPEEVDILIPLVRSGMENVIELIVPLKVSIEIGHNWNDMESVD